MISTEENITLTKFLKKTIEFYINIFVFSIKSILKYWIIPILLFILFSTLFYFQLKKAKTTFNASTSYSYNYLNKKVYGDLLYDIEKLVTNKEYVSISEKLNISIETSKSIISIKALNIVGKPLHEDFSELHVPFYIEVTTNEKTFIDIQKGISYFLNNDKFIMNFISEKIIYNNEKLVLVNKIIETIDSLAYKIKSKNIDKLGDVIKYSNSKLDEKLELEKRIKKTNAVTILRPFVAVSIFKKTVLKNIAIKYISLFFLLSLSLTSLTHFYKNKNI